MGEPQTPEPGTRKARLLLCGGTLLAALALDLITKAWAWEHLHANPGMIIKPGVLVLDFAFNTGSAFGMLADADWARAFFITITLTALVYLGRLALTLPTRWWSGFVGVGLIAGGAMGNLHDRLVRVLAFRTYLADITFSDLLEHSSAVAETLTEARHYVEIDRHGVIDFIVLYYWPQRRWPAFNVADIALSAGVAVFMIYLHRHGGEPVPTGEGGAER